MDHRRLGGVENRLFSRSCRVRSDGLHVPETLRRERQGWNRPAQARAKRICCAFGEAYGADIRIIKDLDIYVGREGACDTPFINGDDTRMTPNTFEGAILQGKVNLGENGGNLKFGAGYFDRIKQRDSDRFISMSDAAGAPVNRGVYSGGGYSTRKETSPSVRSIITARISSISLTPKPT